jgi:K+-transporting ATPase ATPase C chain
MNELRPALVIFALLTLVTGIAYPLLVTGVAQAAFPRQANGSVIESGGRRAGSALLGQPFSAPGYFWSRPSATGGHAYNADASGGSNLGPLNPSLERAVQERIAALRAADPGNQSPVPVDLVTASASGLDPHISPAAAEFQVARVARARAIPTERVRELVRGATADRTFGILGEPRVNVLELNLALDGQRAR